MIIDGSPMKGRRIIVSTSPLGKALNQLYLNNMGIEKHKTTGM